LSPEFPVEVSIVAGIPRLMANRLYQVVRTLLEANRSPSMKALDLRNSSDLQCVNMMCEKVGEACVCRLGRVLEKNGQELRSLCLADNKLTQLPAIVFELPHLQVLDLSGNALEEIPESVVNLKSLKVLDVTGNPISRVPKTVAKQLYGLVEIRRDDLK
jgi:Leucine-rich repeat (LRR) protein